MATVTEDTGCTPDIVGGTDATVRVYALRDDEAGPGEQQIVFALGGKVVPAGNGSVKGNIIKVKVRSGAARIKFRLRDEPGLDLRFRDDPIWIAEGFECPTCPGLAGFSLTDRRNKEITLTTPDKEGDYAYTLRFLDGNNDPHEFDPIIKNFF